MLNLRNSILLIAALMVYAFVHAANTPNYDGGKKKVASKAVAKKVVTSNNVNKPTTNFIPTHKTFSWSGKTTSKLLYKPNLNVVKTNKTASFNSFRNGNTIFIVPINKKAFNAQVGTTTHGPKIIIRKN